MSLPKHVEIMVGFLGKHKAEFLAAQTPQQKIEALNSLKSSLRDISREVDNHALKLPRNKVGPSKQLLKKLDEPQKSVEHLLHALREDPAAPTLSFTLISLDCEKLLQDLHDIWGTNF